MMKPRLLLLLLLLLAVATAQRVVDESLVAWYKFDEGIANLTEVVVRDRSNSPLSPGDLVLNRSRVSWIPGGVGVNISQVSTDEAGTALRSVGTLDAFRDQLVARQAASLNDPDWTIELWFRVPAIWNAPADSCRFVSFSNFTETPGATPNWDVVNYPNNRMHVWGLTNGIITRTSYHEFSSTYVLDGTTAQARSFQIMMISFRMCTRNESAGSDCAWGVPLDSGNPQFASRYLGCLDMRGTQGYTNSGCAWGGVMPSGVTRPLNYTTWFRNMRLEVAGGNSFGAGTQLSWMGYLYQIALYNRSLTPAERTRNWEAGLPRGRPIVPTTVTVSCFQDSVARSVFALPGSAADGTLAHFQILTLPAVGTLYAYDGLAFTNITSVPVFLPRTRLSVSLSLCLSLSLSLSVSRSISIEQRVIRASALQHTGRQLCQLYVSYV
jgi:hypothetical protein